MLKYVNPTTPWNLLINISNTATGYRPHMLTIAKLPIAQTPLRIYKLTDSQGNGIQVLRYIYQSRDFCLLSYPSWTLFFSYLTDKLPVSSSLANFQLKWNHTANEQIFFSMILQLVIITVGCEMLMLLKIYVSFCNGCGDPEVISNSDIVSHNKPQNAAWLLTNEHYRLFSFVEIIRDGSLWVLMSSWFYPMFFNLWPISSWNASVWYAWWVRSSR